MERRTARRGPSVDGVLALQDRELHVTVGKRAALRQHRAVSFDDVPLWSYNLGSGQDGSWYAMTHGLPTLTAFLGADFPETELGPFATEVEALRATSEQLLRDIAWVIDHLLRRPG